MPKADTRDFTGPSATRRSFIGFNGLRLPSRLARGMPIEMAGAGVLSQDREISFETRRFTMFGGKNNRLLDSFSFRAALITAVVALWSGAGYVLLALA